MSLDYALQREARTKAEEKAIQVMSELKWDVCLGELMDTFGYEEDEAQEIVDALSLGTVHMSWGA